MQVLKKFAKSYVPKWRFWVQWEKPKIGLNQILEDNALRCPFMPVHSRIYLLFTNTVCLGLANQSKSAEMSLYAELHEVFTGRTRIEYCQYKEM